VDSSLKRLGIAIEKCSIPVHHYGKLSAETSGRKTETYYNIGRKKRAEIGDNAAVLRELAIQAGHLEKHAEAIELWQHFIKLQPEEPEAYVNMGTAFWHLAKYDQALLAAKTAAGLAPGMKEAHFNYAISELHLGNAHKAVVALENILTRHPGYTAAEFMLSAAYCCDGKKEKGLAGIERIQRTAVGPVLAVTFDDLARRLAAANQSMYSISLLEAAIECGSGNEQLIRLLENYRQAG
jgi:tetratricopeptide (TPR) repeat protein